MIEIEVGKKFPLKEVEEGLMIDMKEEGFVVFIGMEDITKEEIDEFRKGRLTLDLSFINDIMFFVLEIGNFLLSDAPFSTGLIRPIDKLEEMIEKEDDIYSMNLFLVDTSDNILKGIRIIGLTKEFSSTIEHFMKVQKELEFDEEEYKDKIDEIYDVLSLINIRNLRVNRSDI